MSDRVRMCGGWWVYCNGDCQHCPKNHTSYSTTTTSVDGSFIRGCVNKASPSINANNLNRISDTLEAISVRSVAGNGMTHWYECENCHKAVDVGDTYCKHCGARLV